MSGTRRHDITHALRPLDAGCGCQMADIRYCVLCNAVLEAKREAVDTCGPVCTRRLLNMQRAMQEVEEERRICDGSPSQGAAAAAVGGCAPAPTPADTDLPFALYREQAKAVLDLAPWDLIDCRFRASYDRMAQHVLDREALMRGEIDTLRAQLAEAKASKHEEARAILDSNSLEECARLRAKLEQLTAELVDHRHMLSLQHKRMKEATARWRAEKPEERKLTLPDLGVLLAWLMEQSDRREAELASLKSSERARRAKETP